MNFSDIHNEIRLQIGAKKFLNQDKKDIFQEAFLLMTEKKMTAKKAVMKAINKYSYQSRPRRRPKHVDISTVDIAVQEVKPSLVQRHQLSERQQRRLFEKFDSVEKVKAVLESYDYSFNVLQSTTGKYELAIQMVEPCPICGCKNCFTIYETKSYLTYNCYTREDNEYYKEYPNTITGIFSLVTGYSKEEVRDKIYKNLLE